jgi:pentatricopeptide repeat protein
MPEKAIELFEKISIKVDEVIIIILFNACAKLSNDHAIKVGKDVLNRLPNSFLHHQNLINSAIDMLMKFGHVKDAERMFEQMKKKSIVTYGAMMQGNSHGINL